MNESHPGSSFRFQRQHPKSPKTVFEELPIDCHPKKGSASLCPHVIAQKLDPSHHRSQGSSSLLQEEIHRNWMEVSSPCVWNSYGIFCMKCMVFNATSTNHRWKNAPNIMQSSWSALEKERKKRISFLSLRPLVPMPPATTLSRVKKAVYSEWLLNYLPCAVLLLQMPLHSKSIKFQLVSSLMVWFDKSLFRAKPHHHVRVRFVAEECTEILSFHANSFEWSRTEYGWLVDW